MRLINDILKKRYPQPYKEVTHWLNLNGTWDFSFETPVYDKTIEVPYGWGSPLSGIEEVHNGTAYYRRRVRWDPANCRIFLNFGAVDYSCQVTVNGYLLGSHQGGYMPFGFEVTDIWSRVDENVIEVCATDTGEKYQTFGKQEYGNVRGIWQTSWLEARPIAYIKDFCVNTKLDGTVTYAVTTVDAADGCVVSASFEHAQGCGVVKNNKAELVLKIDEPKWWTPEEPNLYEGVLTLGEDVVSTYFGIREIGTGKFGVNNRRYITLNGKPYYINGVLDQSFNPGGYFTLPSDEDCREEILRLKRLGVNMARIHIKAEEPMKLYWADKLGMLIMEDIPCFWGEPLPETRAQFEMEMEQQILRDRNHPSIFYWVIFNETWGLFTNLLNEKGESVRQYTDETVAWVERCWHKAKALDPTRLIEDNSACLQDHTKTDVNTWHFYSNGYERLKKVVDDFCDASFVGSTKNYRDGYAMEDVPCMNSECGNVWGIDGSAGDSDISWQYKYMINEFRAHDKLCGFVFTEFHDVINEFNGYYKIDNSDKDFGYHNYGITIRDLHSQDYLGAEYPPMQTVKSGDRISVPLFGSSFTDKRHGKSLTVAWKLTVEDPIAENYVAESGSLPVVWADYGTFSAGEIAFTVPNHDGTMMLSLALRDGEETVMRNFILFDVVGARSDSLVLSTDALTAHGFDRVVKAKIEKISGLGNGTFSVEVKTADIPGLDTANDLRLLVEASTRFPMTHDYPMGEVEVKRDLDYMLGYRCDAGANRNTFSQTDETFLPGRMTVAIDGKTVTSMLLPDAPADSRGKLSHHYQPADNLLDEAGSYGYLCDVYIPSAILLDLKEKERFTLTFSTDSGNGLAIYGRRSGRYGLGIVLQAQK